MAHFRAGQVMASANYRFGKPVRVFLASAARQPIHNSGQEIMRLEHPHGFSHPVDDERSAVELLRDGYDGHLRRIEDDGRRSVRYDRHEPGIDGWGWYFSGRLYL